MASFEWRILLPRGIEGRSDRGIKDRKARGGRGPWERENGGGRTCSGGAGWRGALAGAAGGAGRGYTGAAAAADGPGGNAQRRRRAAEIGARP
jgi:hypothetical protein